MGYQYAIHVSYPNGSDTPTNQSCVAVYSKQGTAAGIDVIRPSICETVNPRFWTEVHVVISAG